MITFAAKFFGHPDDIEGIHLRRRELVGGIARIPELRAMVFGPFVRRCIGEKTGCKDRWLLGPTRIIG